MRRGLRGLTLLECLVALALTAVCLSLALPAWRDTLQAQRVRAASAALHDGLRLARLEARRNARELRLCPSADGWTCQAPARWEQGWVLLDAKASPGTGPVLVQGPLPGVRIEASVPLAHGAAFDAGGWPRQPGGALLMGRWRICPLGGGRGPQDGRELVLAAGGRVREQPVSCADTG
ncbi:MAG: GspH/FimT family pseudopilin [Betaproteobacteria bacterium]|nr:GspH/FimT family pseudopilin [Betaproteobacteria bacterium]